MAPDRGRRISKERFTKLRVDSMMSLRELADRAGVAFTTVQHIESGETTSPHFGTIKKLAKALGVDPRDLMEREPRPLGDAPTPPRGKTQVEVLQHALALYQEREERSPKKWGYLHAAALFMLERTGHPDLREEYEVLSRRAYDGWLDALGIDRDDPDAAQAIEELLREIREPVEA